MGTGAVGRPAVFLDRDGVLNALTLNPATGRMESPLTPDEFELIDGVIPALQRLRNAGYPLILVSNQPNYALAKSSLATLEAIHDKMVSALDQAGITFARFCYCLHHPRGVTQGLNHLCVCRKPSPWFLLRARDDFGLSLQHSWMIGDRATDIQCGKAAGTHTIRIIANPGLSHSFASVQETGTPADYWARNLAEAVDIVLSQHTS